ncbi:MAG: lsfA2 [Rhizobacter sp.]|nr:lsfA2 [Rhizobacter sp.]
MTRSCPFTPLQPSALDEGPFTRKVNAMSHLHLGDTVPDFEQDTSIGPIKFHEWAGNSWVVFFSHPADFTPVCTTELGLTGKLAPEFAKRNVKAIAISVDDAQSHKDWTQDIEATQKTIVNFPIIADKDKKVASLYDMIHPNQSGTATVRAVFIIDPQKKLRLTLTYPLNVGRNFDEILRVIDALQLADAHSVALPGNWKDGDDVIIPLSFQDEAVIKEKFPKGYRAERPYLRFTPQPNKKGKRARAAAFMPRPSPISASGRLLELAVRVLVGARLLDPLVGAHLRFAHLLAGRLVLPDVVGAGLCARDRCHHQGGCGNAQLEFHVDSFHVHLKARLLPMVTIRFLPCATIAVR